MSLSPTSARRGSCGRCGTTSSVPKPTNCPQDRLPHQTPIPRGCSIHRNNDAASCFFEMGLSALRKSSRVFAFPSVLCPHLPTPGERSVPRAAVTAAPVLCGLSRTAVTGAEFGADSINTHRPVRLHPPLIFGGKRVSFLLPALTKDLNTESSQII